MTPPRSASPAVVVRPAVPGDLQALEALEAASFSSDRTSRRSLRHLLTRAHAAVLVAEDEGGAPGSDAPPPLLGSVTVLFSRGTGTARLYSIAVAPEARGRGVGSRLVRAAEEEAWRGERPWMRLEVRKDNAASIALFESLGYRRFGEHADYYEDHMDAWRYEKSLDGTGGPALARVPYYQQTLDFTCGPASLIMAMKALRPESRWARTNELRIWREATTIFMTSGVGGCGPFGLALAARRRGFAPVVRVSGTGVQLVDTVRSADKKQVMELVQADMLRELRELEVPVGYGALTLDELERAFDAGSIPLVLISSWAIYRTRTPHWVVVTGFDEHFVYLHDPYVDVDEGETRADSMNMPIGREQFRRMARYGRRGLQAAVLVAHGTGAAPVRARGDA